MPEIGNPGEDGGGDRPGRTRRRLLLAGAVGGLGGIAALQAVGPATAALAAGGTGITPSGDTTGATDTANINSAISALGSSGGLISLAAGDYYWTCGSVVISKPGVFIAGAGINATFVHAVGTGDTIQFTFSGTYAASTTDGGGVSGMTFDGKNAGAGSTGIHAGNIFGLYFDVLAKDYQGTGSIGVHFDNSVYWTEGLNGRLQVHANQTGVVFDVSGASTSTNSFARADLDIFVNQANANFDGVVLQNGAALSNARLRITGNFTGSSSAVASAALRITGQVPAGHPGGGDYSSIITSQLLIQVECSPGAFTPQTIVVGSPGNNQISATGVLDFGPSGPTFSPSNLRDAHNVIHTNAFYYQGIINGDSSLGAGSFVSENLAPFVTSGARLFQRGQAWYGTNVLNLASRDGDIFQVASGPLFQNVAVDLDGTGTNKTWGAPQHIWVIIQQAKSGGPYTVTWPHTATPTVSNPTVLWPGGTAPAMSTAAGAVDMYELVTYNGATWYGRVFAQHMS